MAVQPDLAIAKDAIELDRNPFTQVFAGYAETFTIPTDTILRIFAPDLECSHSSTAVTREERTHSLPKPGSG